MEKVQQINRHDLPPIMRPKGQDEKPKGLPLPPYMMVFQPIEPTERRVLNIIAHYPYFLNSFHHSDISRNKQTDNGYYKKYCQIMDSLIAKNYIKADEFYLKWRITHTGKLFRFTTYPGFPLLASIMALISITATVTFGILNYTKKTNTEQQNLNQIGKSQKANTTHTADSVRNTVPQTAGELMKDSVSFDMNKTKTGDSTPIK